MQIIFVCLAPPQPRSKSPSISPTIQKVDENKPMQNDEKGSKSTTDEDVVPKVQKRKSRKSKRKSLYNEMSNPIIEIETSDHDDDNDNGVRKSLLHQDDAGQEEQPSSSPLTQENLYRHERGHSRGRSLHRRRLSSSVGSWSRAGSQDWGGGPFIVKRMSIGSASGGLPTNLNFYHAASGSSHIWELDLPDYYDDLPDSLQRIHARLDRHQSSKSHTHIPTLNEDKTMDEEDDEEENVIAPDEHIPDVVVVDKKQDSDQDVVELEDRVSKSIASGSRRSVRFDDKVVHESDDANKLVQNQTKTDEDATVISSVIPSVILPLQDEKQELEKQVERQELVKAASSSSSTSSASAASTIVVNDGKDKEDRKEERERESDFVGIQVDVEPAAGDERVEFATIESKPARRQGQDSLTMPQEEEEVDMRQSVVLNLAGQEFVSIGGVKDIKEDKSENNADKWRVKHVGVHRKYRVLDQDGSVVQGSDDSEDDKGGRSEDESVESDNNIVIQDRENDDRLRKNRSRDRKMNKIKRLNSLHSDSDSTNSSSRSNVIHDAEVVQEDKLRKELTWKTSYTGIFLIGIVWCSAFHCLYSFSAIVNNVVTALNVQLWEFGLMYASNFIGVGIGLFISSYLLNKPKWIDSSQVVAKNGIFTVFICQLIATLVFFYEYVIHSDESPVAILWIVLVVTRFLMGIAIGFVESSVNNLVFEWFSDDAFNAKLSDDANQAEKDYLAKLSSRVLSYCLFLKEFGHISSRLFLVPLIFFTFSDGTNLFVPLLFGAILSGLGWIGMVYAKQRDKRNNINYQELVSPQESYDEYEQDYLPSVSVSRAKSRNSRIERGYYDDPLDAPASDNDSESTPLLNGNKNNNNNNNNAVNAPRKIQRDIIPEDWSYKDWYDMGLIGLNRSVVLSILFLSINFGISFSFTILSISNIVEQFSYTDYTSNLLICLIPISTLFLSNWLRTHILSKFDSVWTVMFIGCILYSIVFGLFAFCGIEGKTSVWLPILCVIIFILGSECVFASGYELLLSSAPEYIHGLISGVNSSINFIISGLCILIFSVLVIDYTGNMTSYNQYRWAYTFLCFASIINLIIAIILRCSFGAHVNELSTN